MSKTRLHFWETVSALARSTRTSRKVDFAVAADALELERIAQEKIDTLQKEAPPPASSPSQLSTGTEGDHGQ